MGKCGAQYLWGKRISAVTGWEGGGVELSSPHAPPLCVVLWGAGGSYDVIRVVDRVVLG